MDELSQLAIKYDTDKGPHGTYHAYTVRYDKLLRDMRGTARSVLEIGVMNGASLRMWRDYFPNAEIHGLDIDDCSKHIVSGDRITVHCGDAGNRWTLRELAHHHGPFDLVVDDGSHNLDHMRLAFDELYDQTRGILIIEDVHLEWFGAALLADTVPKGGQPEVLISRTADNRAAYIWDRRGK